METVAEAEGGKDVEKSGGWSDDAEKKWSRAEQWCRCVGVTDDSPEMVRAGEAQPSAPSGTFAHPKPLCHLFDSPDTDMIVT